MTGATAFWVAMIKADRAALATADVGKLARKYALPVEWVGFWVRVWRG